jgi:hypothetical protein
MMNSLYFGLALVALLMIVRWYVINDGTAQKDGSIGFLAMKPGRLPVQATAQQSAKTRFRKQR